MRKSIELSPDYLKKLEKVASKVRKLTMLDLESPMKVDLEYHTALIANFGYQVVVELSPKSYGEIKTLDSASKVRYSIVGGKVYPCIETLSIPRIKGVAWKLHPIIKSVTGTIFWE